MTPKLMSLVDIQFPWADNDPAGASDLSNCGLLRIEGTFLGEVNRQIYARDSVAATVSEGERI